MNLYNIEEKIWNYPVICIPKTNINRVLDLKIGIQLNDLKKRLDMPNWKETWLQQKNYQLLKWKAS